MLGHLLGIFGIDLQGQIAKLRSHAEDLKDRAIREAKREAADTSITIGLAFGSLVLGLATLGAALAALYLWVAMARGPFAGLAAVACTTAVLALILAVVAATRGRLSASVPPSHPAARPAASEPLGVPVSATAAPTARTPRAGSLPLFSATSPTSFFDTVTHNLAHRAAVASDDVLDSATDIVRNGSREAIVATLGVAILVGVLIGRRQ
jgi:hypothetical protein